MRAESRKKNVPSIVLNTALHLFTEKGYFNTSIPDIVRASGCSTGSIYHHFSDKTGIAKALYDSLIEKMSTRLNEIEQRYDTTKQRCYEIIKLLFKLADNEPEVMRYMLFAKHREFINDVAPICSTKPFMIMKNMITDGMKSNEVRKMDQMIAVSVVFGGALRLIQLKLDNVLDESLTEKLDAVFDCSWRAISQDIIY